MARRFVWRLETVLKSKFRIEEQRQQELAEALAQLNRAVAERERLAGLQARCRDDLKRRQMGRLNPNDLVQVNAYLETLDTQHRTVETQIEEAHHVVFEKREALAQAVRDRQIFENLKARDYQVYRKEERKRDQTLMDELAARKKWRM